LELRTSIAIAFARSPMVACEHVVGSAARQQGPLHSRHWQPS
jgi:hypothetical protein